MNVKVCQKSQGSNTSACCRNVHDKLTISSWSNFGQNNSGTKGLKTKCVLYRMLFLAGYTYFTKFINVILYSQNLEFVT